MSRNRCCVLSLFVCALIALLAAPQAGHTGPFDSIKKKAEKKAAETVKQADPLAPGEETPDSAQVAPETPPGTSGAGEKVSAVSTKFDFVPGDSVLFLDDFSQDELGEFPIRWKLAQGTFEVAEMEGERWLRCVSVDGRVRMKLPAMASLPEFWTLEFDFYATEPMGSALTVRGMGAGDGVAWEATFPQGSDLAFRSGELFSTTPLESPSVVPGRHHIMFMARGTALKVYIDRQRMANVPDVSTAAGTPLDIEIRLWASTHPMITNVRFAEGCRPAKDMLAEGKLVTYGIHFASGSDVVLPDSAPVLRQIASYMETNPTVKLRITGHTDNVGAAASNLDLSKRRAGSVAKVLLEEFGIAADRFATDGKGDTEPIAKNGQPEGRAMNRRVEFAKL